MKKIKFQHNNFERLKKEIEKDKFGDKVIFNFLNSNDIYAIHNLPEFKRVILDSKLNSFNFPDGFINGLVLSLKKFKRINRIRGPSFTHEFLQDKELNNKRKHFFIGTKEKELDKISKKYGLERKNLFSYNPPYIKKIKFPKEEIKKIKEKINKIKPDYVWVGVGSPKQNILAKDISDTNYKYIFNVGAAIDFALEKKKQAPRIIQELGIEWFYRLVTDFRYSWKKVWKSLIGSILAIKYTELDDER